MEQINQLLVSASAFFLSALCITVILLLFAVLYFLLKHLLKTSMLTVFQGQDTEIKGIPFYVRQGRLTHETSYLETLEIYTLTVKQVQLDDQGKPAASEIVYLGVKTLSQSPAVLQQLTALRLKVQEAQRAKTAEAQKGLLDSIREMFDSFPSYNGQIPTDILLESNQIRESSYVDYSTPYYLNQVQPLSGSSELDFTLAADGTLQKTAAKASDTSFDNLLSLLPTDSLISKPAAEPEADITTQETKPTEKYEIELTVEQKYVRHIFFKVLEATRLLHSSFKPSIPPNEIESWYRREVVTELKPKEAPAAPVEKPKNSEGE